MSLGMIAPADISLSNSKESHTASRAEKLNQSNPLNQNGQASAPKRGLPTF